MNVPNEEMVNIIKKLNEKNKHAAKSFLTWLLEEQLENEDDVLTREDIQAIKQARKEMENGGTFSLEEIKRELEI